MINKDKERMQTLSKEIKKLGQWVRVYSSAVKTTAKTPTAMPASHIGVPQLKYQVYF